MVAVAKLQTIVVIGGGGRGGGVGGGVGVGVAAAAAVIIAVNNIVVKNLHLSVIMTCKRCKAGWKNPL